MAKTIKEISLAPNLVKAHLHLHGDKAEVTFHIDQDGLRNVRSDSRGQPVDLSKITGAPAPGLSFPVSENGEWREEVSSAPSRRGVDLMERGPISPTMSVVVNPTLVQQRGMGAFVDLNLSESDEVVRAWITQPTNNLWPTPEPEWQPAGKRKHMIGGGGSIPDLNGKSKPLNRAPPNAFLNYQGAPQFEAQLPDEVKPPLNIGLTQPVGEVAEIVDGSVRRAPLRLFHGTSHKNAVDMIENVGPQATAWLPRIVSGFFTSESFTEAARFSALRVKRDRARDPNPSPISADDLVVLEMKIDPKARVVDLRGLRGDGPKGAALAAYQWFKEQVDSGKMKLPELDAFEKDVLRVYGHRQYVVDEARQAKSSEEAFAHLAGAQLLRATGSYTVDGVTQAVDEVVVLDPRVIQNVRWYSGNDLPNGITSWY